DRWRGRRPPGPHRGATAKRGRRELEDGRGGPQGPQRHAPRARASQSWGDRAAAAARGTRQASVVAQGVGEV
ncbi:MAG: hypothetical protein AVDCRST_MAG03-618, partial [uncultured Rubrobacteraceae bacterium]